MKDAIRRITRSSKGDGSLSLTFKGIALMLVPVIISVANLSGIRIAETDLTQLVNEVFYIASNIVIVVGLARKLYFKFK